MKKRKHKPQLRYTLMHEISASPTEPLPQAWRTSQLTKMWQGLMSLRQPQSQQRTHGVYVAMPLT
jgi:hypothetical protein